MFLENQQVTIYMSARGGYGGTEACSESEVTLSDPHAETTASPERRTYTATYIVSLPEEYYSYLKAKLMEQLRYGRSRKRGGKQKVPFYRCFIRDPFPVLKTIGRQNTKFNRNVRPKGTHSHFKFYR